MTVAPEANEWASLLKSLSWREQGELLFFLKCRETAFQLLRKGKRHFTHRDVQVRFLAFLQSTKSQNAA